VITHRLILRLLPLLLLTSCSPPTPPPPAANEAPPQPVRLVITDAGRPEWGPVYSLGDGQATLQLAPSIGRVMHVSRVGEANLLWTSNDPDRESFRGWKPFGGEKLWPWPQKPSWAWPPPVAIDTGPYHCEPLADGRNGVTLTGPVDPRSGLAAARQTWLDNGAVLSRYTLERRQPENTDTRVAAWSVAQVPPVEAVYVRLLPGHSDASGAPAADPLKTERVNDRWLKVTARYDGSKLYLPGNLIATPIGDRLLVVERTEGNDDPNLDLTSAAQVYFHRKPKGGRADEPSVFAEVELIGPSRSLAVGESCNLTTRWTILPIDQLPELLNSR
jgi:hypothetical protein